MCACVGWTYLSSFSFCIWCRDSHNLGSNGQPWRDNVVETASGLSTRFLFRPSFSAMLSKQSSVMWLLQTSQYALGSFQSALVFFSLLIYLICIRPSLGNWWRLTPTFVVLLQPATIRLPMLLQRTLVYTFLLWRYHFAPPKTQSILKITILFDACSIFVSIFLASGYRIVVDYKTKKEWTVV